jgi:ArsR family transcriptional regulator
MKEEIYYMGLFNNEERLEQAVECLKVLAHPLRLKILSCIMESSMNVSALEKIVKTSQPNISQHLAIMRYKGMLKQEKKGNEVFYSIKNDRLKKMLMSIGDLFCQKDDEV